MGLFARLSEYLSTRTSTSVYFVTLHIISAVCSGLTRCTCEISNVLLAGGQVVDLHNHLFFIATLACIQNNYKWAAKSKACADPVSFARGS